MAIPSFHAMIDPLLRVLANEPNGLSARRAQDMVADMLQLTNDDKNLRLPSGTQLVFRHRTNWAHDRLKRAQLSSTPRRGVWQLTDAGLAHVRAHPNSLENNELRELARAGRDQRMVAFVPASATARNLTSQSEDSKRPVNQPELTA